MAASVYIPPGGHGDVRPQLAQEDGRTSVRPAIDRGFKWSPTSPRSEPRGCSILNLNLNPKGIANVGVLGARSRWLIQAPDCSAAGRTLATAPTRRVRELSSSTALTLSRWTATHARLLGAVRGRAPHTARCYLPLELRYGRHSAPFSARRCGCRNQSQTCICKLVPLRDTPAAKHYTR